MIYLDYNSTTSIAPEVLEAMMPFFSEHFGNPASSQHAYGWRADEAVKIASEQIALLLNIEPEEIIYTSGATESCNLAIKGIFDLYQVKGKHIVTVKTEHKAVLDTCKELKSRGAEVTYLDVNKKGRLDLDALRNAIRMDTVLVAVMWANNETGLIHPMQEIGNICREKGVILFSDATQAFSKIELHPKVDGVNLMALSAHKCYGPKGVGALYVSRNAPRIKLAPQIHGGGHQHGLRSGTLNVPGIVALGAIAKLADQWIAEYDTTIRGLRDFLEKELLKLPGVAVNGRKKKRLPHVSNLRFDGIDGSELMTSLSRDLCMASGSACTTADPEPSHVLRAMGLTKAEAKSSLRFSLGKDNTRKDIESAVALIKNRLSGLQQ